MQEYHTYGVLGSDILSIIIDLLPIRSYRCISGANGILHAYMKARYFIKIIRALYLLNLKQKCDKVINNNLLCTISLGETLTIWPDIICLGWMCRNNFCDNKGPLNKCCGYHFGVYSNNHMNMEFAKQERDPSYT